MVEHEQLQEAALTGDVEQAVRVLIVHLQVGLGTVRTILEARQGSDPAVRESPLARKIAGTEGYHMSRVAYKCRGPPGAMSRRGFWPIEELQLTKKEGTLCSGRI
jgi:hypothetical protein